MAERPRKKIERFFRPKSQLSFMIRFRPVRSGSAFFLAWKYDSSIRNMARIPQIKIVIPDTSQGRAILIAPI